MGREFELKYAATPEKLAVIRTKWEEWTVISMETTYFDTPDGVLSSKKCTLRQRMENGICICTMKTPATGYGRGEWNVTAGWNEETVEKLFSMAGQALIPVEQLKAICGARFTRFAKVLALPDCTVEVALDEGVLMGGDRQIPLCEVEVELKSGDETAATVWAGKLAEQYHLEAEPRSKFSRASALAKGE